MSHPSSAEETLTSQFEPRSDLNEKEISGVQAPAGFDDDFPHGLKLMVLLVALCLAVFLVALDNTIIATAIPKITDQFKSLDDVGWYGSSYLLAIASTQLLFGKFYTFLPVKSVFLAAISVFELGSLICGVAPNSKALIVGRAIAGLGSAGIFTGALIIMGWSTACGELTDLKLSAAHSVPLAKRPMYTGLIGAMFGIASVAGPLMGGAFTDKVSWRWCFYINLPIGAITIFAITFFFKMPESANHKASEVSLPWRQRIDRFDPLGTLIFIPAIVCLLLALQWGGSESKYPWNSGRIIALFVVFGVFAAAFVMIQIWQQENATVPPRIFMKRTVWGSGWFSMCLGASFFIVIFYLPIWFQAIKGTSAVKSGIDNLPLILPMVIAMILSGVLITQFGYYTPFILLSTVMSTVGAGLISTFKTNTGHSHWMGYQALYGLGLGIGMQTPLIAVQTVLDLKDVPTGTAINIFLQSLGGSLFISVAQSVFQNKLISELVARVPGISPELILTAGATNLKNAVDPQYLSAVLEVYNDALVIAFRVATAMAGISIIGALAVEWKSVKGKNIEMAVA
ncbi:Major facilitator superfamily transporter [Mycena sanguinolenta]|uniref:Major facilitator superfamily transporter n=1 Tax=Mycena sanguinolenta TaxID=230812 RepID=A0A8H6YY30_9AGAR|nr:Major facilitator superfamily transporter [Mycena sanguinolenta]